MALDPMHLAVSPSAKFVAIWPSGRARVVGVVECTHKPLAYVAYVNIIVPWHEWSVPTG